MREIVQSLCFYYSTLMYLELIDVGITTFNTPSFIELRIDSDIAELGRYQDLQYSHLSYPTLSLADMLSTLFSTLSLTSSFLVPGR